MLRRTKIFLLGLAVLVLAVEAYFLYSHYELYYGSGPAQNVAGLSSSGEATSSTSSMPPDSSGQSGETEGGETMFVHRATPENIVDNSTYVDHPSISENPRAVLLVTQTQEPESAVVNSHPIGVWYDTNRGGKWAIFNQDLAPMPEGAAFNVVVPEEGDETTVHRATPANTAGNETYLDHPLANGNPGAVLSVTPNWNPDGLSGTYNNHLVNLRYDFDRGKWAVLNQDLAQMPQNAAFNVLLSGDFPKEE